MTFLDERIRKVVDALLGPNVTDPPLRPPRPVRGPPEEPQAHRNRFRTPAGVIDLSLPLDTIADQTEAAFEHARPQYPYEGDDECPEE